jgi:hypothetical protein
VNRLDDGSLPQAPLSAEANVKRASDFNLMQPRRASVQCLSAGAPMNVVEATESYERWASTEISLFSKDLKYKHRQMDKGAFPFLRATFYRWVQQWSGICPDLAAAPSLLAVGDLHIENFGTWRDAEGRLVWGVNDFDEAARAPYTLDLVRLAASAVLAIKEDRLAIAADKACELILDGYVGRLSRGPQCFVLEESHSPIRAMALGEDRDPDPFWEKMHKLPKSARVPDDVRKLLAGSLPDPKLRFSVVHRRAGLGSLGHPRFTALARWNDAMIAREVKALLPSAYGWALGRPGTASASERLMNCAVRSPDPSWTVNGRWILRRLGPHASRVELADYRKKRYERDILQAMGAETANVHFGTHQAIASVKKDLEARKSKWLFAAAVKMAAATHDDWRRWKAR